ncbi:MAG TPA: hypothetical protein PKD86_09370 [Gemmatales bacterium]|nr:hypothetical protein [Gemmatales bacterium]HMP59549.1 hypothetical protein [Gemmatales bacterium]
MVQIIPSVAPAKLSQALQWLQTTYDELEYVEFLVALEELADALYKPAEPGAAPDRGRKAGPGR